MNPKHTHQYQARLCEEITLNNNALKTEAHNEDTRQELMQNNRNLHAQLAEARRNN